MDFVLAAVVFLFGIVVGSFLNVLIYRLPKNENIAIVRSHCMNCDYSLRWYDLIPVFSYLLLRGKCRKCGTTISFQYPLIELLNGILWVFVIYWKGFSLRGLLACFVTSIFLVIAVIDFRTFLIPEGLCYAIFVLGVLETILDWENWSLHVIGFGAVSLFLLLIHLMNKNWLGGGDVRLMATAGLFLGWKNIVLGLVLGCILGSVIHLLRMKISHVGRTLSFGPYLVAGMFLSMLFGDIMIQWYLQMMFA